VSLSVTDIFCGGGGSSTGMVAIPGVVVVWAANHWDLAVEAHNSNHPEADHAAVDLHEEDPRFFPATDILWASPECTKWSQASGGRYSSISTSIDGDLLDLLNPDLVEEDPEVAIVQRSRLLMFDVLRFVEHHRYRAIVVENVVDIATNKRFAPEWALWRKGLRNLGYEHRVVSLNSMHAQAHGDPAPQSRDRLYIVCWRKGDRAPNIDGALRPLAWCPTCGEVIESQQAWKNGRTVGKYRSQYVYIHAACGATVEPGHLPAAAAIDWSLPGKRIGDRVKPLADKTRRRVAAGIARYWRRPFTAEAAGNTYDAASPRHPAHGDPNGYYRVWSTLDTLRTLHTHETKALVQPPFIAELRGGGSDARPASDPLSTVTASGNHHALVMPYYGASESALPVSRPIGTLTTVDRYALLTRHYTSKGAGAEMTTLASEPMRTLTTTAQQSVITPGEIEAAEAQVDDCLFRMLEPHEVAAGMAFPADYIWSGTRRERVKLAGNAVTPPAARDLIAAVAEALL
jgi:DNA (cytosine-5)-methyltransferase 1